METPEQLAAAEALLNAGFGEEGAILNQEEVQVEQVEEETEPTSEEPEQEEPVEEEEEKKVPLKAVMEERKKRQEYEERLKRQEEEIQALKQTLPKPPPKDVYEAYDQDSNGVIASLNNEIDKLVADDPYGHASRIEKLRDLKAELRNREVQKITQHLSQQTEAAKVIAEVKAACPDIDELIAPQGDEPVGPLVRFAVEQLGYTQEDLQELEPHRGMSAARKAKALYKAYKLAHPTPEKKEAKPRPTPVEQAGRGIPKQAVNADALFERAKRSGKNDDWAEYFIAKGLV